MDWIALANSGSSFFAAVAAIVWLRASQASVKGPYPDMSELVVGVMHNGREDTQYRGALVYASAFKQAQLNSYAAIAACFAAGCQAVVLITPVVIGASRACLTSVAQ